MRILVLNGSPAGEDSITLFTVKYWEKLFPEEVFETLHVGQRIRQFEKDFREAGEKLMAADLILGPGEGADKAAKDAHYALIRELCDEFRAETGSIVCRELLGLAPAQSDPPVSEARTPAYYKKRPCAELVALAAGILSKRLPD